MSNDTLKACPRRDLFATTRWTLVHSAGRKSSPDSERALAELCQIYWYPLYAYVRRQGRTREDAEDLVQDFFAQLFMGRVFEGLAAERGKFRAYLLAAMKHLLANRWDRQRAQKRGGGAEHLSLDWTGAEERFRLDPPDLRTPDQLFDREWAWALLDRVVKRLSDECGRDGKGQLFLQAKRFLLAGQDALPYADAARELGMEAGALRVAVHRLRKRYRELLRDEICQTVCDPGSVEEEMRALQAALMG